MHNFRDFSVRMTNSEGFLRVCKLAELSNDPNQGLHELLIEFTRFALAEQVAYKYEWTMFEWQYKGAKTYVKTDKMDTEELTQFYRNLQA